MSVDDERGCILRVLVAMMLADDDADPDEATTIRDVYAKVTGTVLAAGQLEAEAQRVSAAGISLEHCADDFAGRLDLGAKRRVLSAAFAVATADGFVLEEEDEALVAVGKALGMSEPEYKDALMELVSGQSLH